MAMVAAVMALALGLAVTAAVAAAAAMAVVRWWRRGPGGWVAKVAGRRR